MISMWPSDSRRSFLVLLGLGLLVSVLLSLMFGATNIDLVIAISDPSSTDRLILLNERLPRTVLGALVGGSLASAGLVFQAILKNPLADPYVIGSAGGAAIGGTVALLLPISAIFGHAGVAMSAFLSGLGSIVLIYRFSRDRGGKIRSYEVLLTGVIFNTFASAVIMFLKIVVRAEKTQEILLWLMGTLNSDIRSPYAILAVAVLFLSAILVLYRISPALNALALGEEDAATVGVDPVKTTRIVLVAGSLLVAGAVSVAGMIGFVGLIVPHGVRAMIGSDHRLTLPASALLGALFLVLADLGTRLFFPVFSTEAPVGVLTAFIGGPLFIYLLRRGEGLS